MTQKISASINQNFTINLTHDNELRDIGFVLLPNQECKDFLTQMSIRAADTNHHLKPTIPFGLTSIKPHLVNNYHVTLVHIANQNEKNQIAIKEAFMAHYQRENIASKIVNFEITGITQTGALAHGYRWFDLNYNPSNPTLIEIRKNILAEFCPWHNGTLARMFDDPFTPAKIVQVEFCGTSFDFANYIPHHTTHYVNLPEEKNGTTNFPVNMPIPPYLDCYATHIAIGEVERNGNLATIIHQLPLAIDPIHLSGQMNHDEL